MSEHPINADSIICSFVKLIADGIRKELAIDSTAVRTVAPRLLSIEGGAIYLGRSKASLQHLVSQRRIPVVREGGRVFLDVRELDKWIEQNTEPAQV